MEKKKVSVYCMNLQIFLTLILVLNYYCYFFPSECQPTDIKFHSENNTDLNIRQAYKN